MCALDIHNERAQITARTNTHIHETAKFIVEYTENTRRIHREYGENTRRVHGARRKYAESTQQIRGEYTESTRSTRRIHGEYTEYAKSTQEIRGKYAVNTRKYTENPRRTITSIAASASSPLSAAPAAVDKNPLPGTELLANYHSLSWSNRTQTIPPFIGRRRVSSRFS